MTTLYYSSLGFLILSNVALHGIQRLRSSPPSPDFTQQPQDSSLVKRYLIGILLASAGDWLQGPHIYAVYKYDKQLEERTVASLYATGFVSGAISAVVAGQLADKYGRKKACLAYCVSYILCCLSMLSDNLLILYLGRIFGGLGTVLLYSVFEAWLIAEYNDSDLRESPTSLGSILGKQTSLNSVVAIITGVVGELLVTITGTRIAPFLLACIFLVLAAAYMSLAWDENYGASPDKQPTTRRYAIFQTMQLFWTDKKLLALTLSSATFESMIYVFIFYWSPAMKSVRSAAGIDADAPLGLLFSCFMCAVLLGSMVFTSYNDGGNPRITGYFLKFAMILASFCLFSTILEATEELYLWAFCAIELGVGLYYPSMGLLKSVVVEDDVRAKVYGLMRMPVDIIVVIVHSLAREGDEHRYKVFSSFGIALLVAYVVAQCILE